MDVQRVIKIRFKPISTKKGISTSLILTFTLLALCACAMTLLSLQTFENKAAKIVEKPTDRSHGNAMHALEQPWILAIESS
mmetsp:Transcript_3800/g.7758  ORF Transcript_3800/g.7758 Transcript_3800/m.7758 type:complete len:81 (+) Transcript_3800:121-363(+)